jgi:hypothetical protein
MSDALSPAPGRPDPSDLEDLTDRLVRLRDRMEREGRSAAIEKIDRAIDEARGRRRPRS